MKRKSCFFIFTAISLSLSGLSQTNDSSRIQQHFSGTASITNNGISLVPSFSLGRPAVLFLMSLGGDRFSFDPDIRFALDGKPWTFLFWARYKLVPRGRFRLTTGGHLGLNFRTTTLLVNDVPADNIVVRRYLAGELSPQYALAKNISAGGYYLYSHGIDPGAVRHTHFVTLNTHFSRLAITPGWYFRFNPQVYFLYQDGRDGFYATSVFTIAKPNFPLSVSSIINKQLRSNIPGTKDFIWNVSLNYSFSRNYVLRAPVL